MPQLESVKGFSLFFLLNMLNDPLLYPAKLQQEYGDFFYKKIGWTDNYYVIRPDYVEHVLYKNQQNYRKHETLVELMSLPFGRHNIFFSNYTDEQLRDRKLTLTAFDADCHFQNYAKVIQQECQVALNNWDDLLLNNPISEINFQAEFDNLVLRITTNTLFYDIDLNTDRLNEHIQASLKSILRQLNPFVRLAWIFPVKSKRDYLAHIKKINEMKVKMIESRLSSGKNYDDILSTHMNAYDVKNKDSEYFSHVGNNVMMVNVAAYFTTSSVLSWIFVTLTQHPEVDKQVTEEVNKVCGGNQPSYEDIPKLKFLQAVVCEILRLYPVVTHLHREAIDADEIDGQAIAANSGLFILIYNIHRHPEYWVNPDQFNPQRFLDKPWGQDHQYAYIPFGGGKRACLGRNFAFMEICLIYATITQRFQFSSLLDNSIEVNSSMFFLRPRQTKILLKKRII